jgi:hypothetical protein
LALPRPPPAFASSERVFRSPTDAETGRCRAGRCAFRSVRRATRADKSSQDLALRATNGIRPSDDASRRRRAGVTLRAGRPGRTDRASGSLRSGRAAFAAGPRRALCAGLALRTLRSNRAGRSRRTSRTALADGALWTDGSLRALCTLRASRPDRPSRASFASRSGRTLRPWRRGATRHHDEGEGSRNYQQLSHRRLPRDETVHWPIDQGQAERALIAAEGENF